VAGNCHRHYEAAPDFIKRQINQGFFRKLIINTDGSVERAELTEPFAQLLAPDWTAATGSALRAPDAPGRLPAPRTADGNAPGALSALGRPGHTLAGVTAGGTTKNPDGDLVGVGSHKGCLVDLLGALAGPTHATQRLLKIGGGWTKLPAPAVMQPCYQGKQVPSLAERLGEAGVQHLIMSYHCGTTGPQLATLHGCSLSSIKRLLRSRQVRLS